MCVSPYIKEIDGVLTPLPCGKCVECLKRYSFDWDFRLKQELKRCPVCWFVTLTYNDFFLPSYFNGVRQESCVIPRELQLFFKRLRKNLGFPELRYFAVGEYGKKNRAHYHALIFTKALPTQMVAYFQILNAWQGRGFIYVKRATPERFHYLTKYVNKLDRRPHIAKPFKIMSNGIGLNFLSDRMTKFFLQHPHRHVVSDGKKLPLPRYYVKKLNDLLSYRHTLNFSELCSIYKPIKSVLCNDVRWYHQYFCDNYDEIRLQFIDNELENECITKFLDPTMNQVFCWFMHVNDVTFSALKRNEEILSYIEMKNGSTDFDADIGSDEILFFKDDY